jgi:hypothetical protein
MSDFHSRCSEGRSGRYARQDACRGSFRASMVDGGVLYHSQLVYYAPWGCGFEPVQAESGYVHRSEDVRYQVQLSLPLLDE